MSEANPSEALGGLRVLNLSSNLAGAFIGQIFADYGAEVVLVEPPGGSPLRAQPGWSIWSRGSKSLGASLDDPAVRALALRSDVLIDTFRPGVLERHGLGHDQLAALNPRLVTACVTGFGRRGPYAHLKGYEAMVMAKIGAYTQVTATVTRDGPAFATVPYCTVSAAFLATAGALAALYERETSGVGQRVDTSLLQAIASQDTWNWMVAFISRKYPGAYQAAPVVNTQRKVPNSWLSFGLLQGLSADGRWMQFSQANPKLFRAFLTATGLDDPAWEDAWQDEDLDRREAFWERLLGAVRARTIAEWREIFDAHPDVFAEIFRSGWELLDHPQMQHDDQVATLDLPGLGRVRQPKPFAKLSRTPGSAFRPRPALDEHGAELRAAAEPPRSAAAPAAAPTAPPLAGLTILDLGNFYAAPYGLSVLADLGARVIKVEPPAGDNIRHQLPFPEIGGVKVMQGKESVAIDLNTPAGLEIVKRLARDADLLMHNFRAGVSRRMGVDEPSVRAVNPDIIYHDAPGFGTGGPYGRRPAYAPTIGAGSGMARRNIKNAVPEGPDLTLDEVKDGAIRMSAANLSVGHADGFSALGVLVAELIALLAKKRGLGGQSIVTTMLATMAQVLSEDMIDYAGRPEAPTADAELYGLSPLYRLYETAEGWVFLAAPAEDDWAALKAAMPRAGLDDPRFATAEGRAAAAEDLAATLAAAFRADTAEAWEDRLTAADVGCAKVHGGPAHDALMLPGGLADQTGILTHVPHRLFDEHPRLTSVIEFSRSATLAGPSPVIGQQTRAVLAEFGYGADDLARLEADKIIVQG
jgi:crotonobetainyl-CoA:carnitine CoA-transferase CaiB-like acyl-CoA transferase